MNGKFAYRSCISHTPYFRSVCRWFFHSSCLVRNNNKSKKKYAKHRSGRGRRTYRLAASCYIKQRPTVNTFVFFPINPFTGYERYANNNVNCRENSAKTAYGNTVFNSRNCVTFRFTSEDHSGPTRVRELRITECTRKIPIFFVHAPGAISQLKKVGRPLVQLRKQLTHGFDGATFTAHKIHTKYTTSKPVGKICFQLR